MKLTSSFCLTVGVLFFAAGIFTTAAQASNFVPRVPFHRPDNPPAVEMLPSNVVVWDALEKAVVATNGQDFARFIFSFTNVSPGKITISDVHPSCGCTTAELPPVPWTIPAGSNGQIKIKVDLEGKVGILFKTVTVKTDKGNKDLTLRITIQPLVIPKQTSAESARALAMAKVDRQAVFKGQCATCHIGNIHTRSGEMLYENLCAICHEAKPRATMVPDLHNLKDKTGEEFWRNWITNGKPGTLMPAFSLSQGGPLSDQQINMIVAYLNFVITQKGAVGPDM